MLFQMLKNTVEFKKTVLININLLYHNSEMGRVMQLQMKYGHLSFLG